MNPEAEVAEDPLRRAYFFQELPPDVRMVVLQGVKFRAARESLPKEVGMFDLDDLLDEEADDIINRNNCRRSLR